MKKASSRSSRQSRRSHSSPSPKPMRGSLYRLSSSSEKRKTEAKKKKAKSKDKDHLSVGEHLEELRWRLIAVILTVLGISLLVFFFSRLIHNFLIGPYSALTDQKLLLHNVYGSIEVLIKISLSLGLTLSLPICLSILWRFITPALSRKMAWIGHLSVGASALLFWGGLSLAWFYIFPLALHFLFQDMLLDGVSPQTTVEKYYSFLFLLHIGCGLAFQLPLLGLVLGILEIIPIDWHKKNWKYLVVATLLFTALVTPPDPLSQLVLSLLLLCLYGLSLLLLWIILKSRRRRG